MTESFLRAGRTSLALAAAVFITASASILLTRDHTEIAAVWIPNAVVLATLLHAQERLWPTLLGVAYVANAFANFATGNGWIIAVFCSAGNIAEILLCAWVLTRENTPRFDVARGSDFLRLLAGAILGALVSATIATIAIAFHNDIAPAELFVSWFLADGLGLIVFTPTFAVLLGGSWRDALRGPHDTSRALLYWAAFAVGVAAVFGQSTVDLLPAAPLLVILVAFAFEASGVALALAAISCVAIGATALAAGPESMTQGSTTYRLHHLQGFLALLVFSGMPAAIALSQRRKLQSSLHAAHQEALSAHDALAVSEGRLQAIAAAARDIIVRYERDTTMTYVSAASLQVLGYAPDELVGRRMWHFIHPDDADRGAAELAAVIAAGPSAPPLKMRLRTRHKNGGWRWIEGCPRATFDARTGETKALYDVMRDVTDQQEASDALLLARERAEAAVNAKSEFLANMSHELRTPLNSVIGFSRLLTQTDELSEQNKRYASIIEASSRATLAIVNDVLDMSTMERGARVLCANAASLSDVLMSVRDMITPSADAKGLFVEMSVDQDLTPHHLVDSDRLRQILLNLASNAVKFTDHGGVSLRVEVEASSANQQIIRFSVRDTGMGIAPEHQRQIFERFVQAPGREGGGTGLGLSIARSLVELMGGAITVDSDLGRGSTFAFTIAAPIATSAVMTREERAQYVPPRRVLIVDDVDLNRELAQRILESMGHVVEVAGSGEEAIERCERAAYDLILMDVRMPGSDGVTTTRVIRMGNGLCADAPIVALSAGALPAQVRACLDAGMNEHLAKPVRPEALAAAIARWTRQAVAPSSHVPSSDLCKKFRERLSDDRRALAAWRTVNAAPSELQPIVHRLAGSAGSFGHEAIGERAGLLNDAIERGDVNWRGLLDDLISSLDADAAAGPARPAA